MSPLDKCPFAPSVGKVVMSSDNREVEREMREREKGSLEGNLGTSTALYIYILGESTVL